MVRFFLPSLLGILLLTVAATAQGATPAVTSNAGEAEAQKCEDRIASVQRDVLSRYDTGLLELQNSFQKAADLEGALAVRAERQRLSQDNHLAQENYVNEPKALRALQTQTVAKLQELVSQLVDDTMPKLVEFKKSLTVAGRLDEAVAVRAAIERLQGNFLSGAPPAAGSVTPVDTLLRAYAADRGRADTLYRNQHLLLHGTVVGYRADPDGKHYNVYLGGVPPTAGYVQCSFASNEFHFHEENQFGNAVLIVTWGPKESMSIRLQRGVQVDIGGQGGGWEDAARLVKCEFPK